MSHESQSLASITQYCLSAQYNTIDSIFQSKVPGNISMCLKHFKYPFGGILHIHQDVFKDQTSGGGPLCGNK